MLRLVLTLTALATSFAMSTVGAADEPAAGQIELKLLFAGKPASPRTKDYVAFLRQHFTEVAVTDYVRFREKDAEGHDVILFEWATPRDAQGRTRLGADSVPPSVSLSKDFSRPTVVIGAAARRLKSVPVKIDWFCLCLEDVAHGVRESHEIFQRPLPVRIDYEEVETSPFYEQWPGGDALGKTMQVWRVQTRKLPEIDAGLVSDPYGFEDSPDAEIISSGLNGKSHESVAIGRHGNYFLWGFSASPSDMTAEARKCFVNSICYIRKFDGQKPIATSTAGDRIWPQLFAAQTRWSHRFHKQNFPKPLVRRFGEDFEKYVDYYRENIEYLHPLNRGMFDVDEDARMLGLSNRKVEILDRCVEMLESDEQPDLARRLLERYTTEEFEDASEWRAWLEGNRERLFFTDRGGFKFLVNTVSRTSSSDQVGGRQEPSGEDPVVVSASLLPVEGGDRSLFDIVIEAQTAPGWHIYTLDRPSGVAVRTMLELELPDSVETEGDWEAPTPVDKSVGNKEVWVYEGDVTFRRRLKMKTDLRPGAVEVKCTITWQACNAFSCQPPKSAELIAKIRSPQ